MNKALSLLFLGYLLSCQTPKEVPNNVITSDIDLFWNAYDQIVQETDSIKQIELFNELYISKGSLGLEKMMEVKAYTAEEYIELINRYPKYWNSIRDNTYQAENIAKKLNDGIEKLGAIYPSLRPAKIYFTVGAMRSNGTTRDSLVLLGSELALADSLTDISEFEGRTKEWLSNFFSTNPIDGVVLLNVHEYVHTQQKPIPSDLLYQVLYEGVAEFVSVKAMGVPSNSPAIEYGKSNPQVRATFEEEMFYNWTHQWLWSNASNDFDIRDLGYYIGYAIAEKHYEQTVDKSEAIKELIEIDYSQSEKVDAFIDATGYFSRPIAVLRADDEQKRPRVLSIQQFDNGNQFVDPNVRELTIEFSEPMSFNTGVDYGALGADAFPEVTDRSWSADQKTWTLTVKLEPETQYQFWLTNNFRNQANIPLQPYLIEFKTIGKQLFLHSSERKSEKKEVHISSN